MPTGQALDIADEQGLDLVEVASDADPPVCRIMDYGKHKFKQRTRKRQAKKHQRVVVLKEIRMRPKIERHDFGFKVDHIRKFLLHGDRVRVTIQFRGREMAHPEVGQRIVRKVIESLEDISTAEAMPKRLGRNISVTLAPAIKKPKEKQRESKDEAKKGSQSAL